MEKKPAKPRVKEIKYGMSVLANVGDFENVRTSIELTADVMDGDDVDACIDSLRETVKSWSRSAYREIKGRAKGAGVKAK